MYHKKKKNNFKFINKSQNYAVDKNGQKKFWLTKRVPKKEFDILKLKFNFTYKPWVLKKKKLNFCCPIAKNIHMFKNWFFFLSIKKTKKNIFANFSNIFGQVIYKASSGFFHKRSLRKTYFATNFLLKKMQNTIVIKKLLLNKKVKKIKKIYFFLNIIGGNYQRGFRKNLKDFLKKGSSKFYKISEIKCKAHNGVRKSKKRRK